MTTGGLDLIEAKRFEDRSPSEVNINVNIEDVKRQGTSSDFTIAFGFDVQYSPNVGYIRIKGSLTFRGSADDAASFESTSRLPDASMQAVANSIIQNCTVQTVMVSSMLRLPPPISIPSVNLKRPARPDGDVTYIG